MPRQKYPGLGAGLGHRPHAKLTIQFNAWVSAMVTHSYTSDAGATACQLFARFCADLDYEELPPVAIERVKGLTSRRVSFVDFTPRSLAAPEIRRLMNLTTCRVDPALDAQYPAAWPARLEVNLADGRTLCASVQHAKGDPRNPLSEDEVIAKHRSIVVGIVGHQTERQYWTSSSAWRRNRISPS